MCVCVCVSLSLSLSPFGHSTLSSETHNQTHYNETGHSTLSSETHNQTYYNETGHSTLSSKTHHQTHHNETGPASQVPPDQVYRYPGISNQVDIPSLFYRYIILFQPSGERDDTHARKKQRGFWLVLNQVLEEEQLSGEGRRRFKKLGLD